MSLAAVLRRGLGAVTLAAFASGAAAVGDVAATARELREARNWPALVELLSEHLRYQVASPELDELLALGLMNVGRRDEAAHHFDRAIAGLGGQEKAAAALRRRLFECDTLAARRDALFKTVAKEMLDCAAKLEAAGHRERALEILERIQPVARAAELASITALTEKIRAATTQVDLDTHGGASRPADGWPRITLESQRYTLVVRLEPEVAELLGRTMDEIYDYYVRIYFDGDEKGIVARKATIRIHASHAEMAGHWQGEQAPAGWWSPGDWEVNAYDTRTDSGTLDQMLLTLFHEASHHFMTMLAKGGGTPAWLNEGTASFFEGASAMADGRVLWPDAARDRLYSLDLMLKGQGFDPGRVPKLIDVIAYDQPGSYAAEYYPFGWGLVYFMQQYEDPVTFEYVYRPLYERYRDEIIRKGGNPRTWFETVFLGSASPLGHANLLAFERDWRAWLQGTIYPLHFGSGRRVLRLQAAERYLAAAQIAANDKKAKVSAQELLLRALGHLDFVRTKIDKPDEPDPALLVRQADVLERVGRASSAAPILEQLIELAGTGNWEPPPAELEALEKRLSRLDSKNAPLRIAKSRARGLARRASLLLADYRALAEKLRAAAERADAERSAGAPTPLLLRTYTFAALAAAALDDPSGLGAQAAQLRARAREAGLLQGAIYRLAGGDGTWKTIYTERENTKFSATPARIEIEDVRPVGRVCTAVPISGEYEVRARITRAGETPMGSCHGLVFSGTATGDWMAMVVDFGGRLMLKPLRLGSGGGVTDAAEEYVNLKHPPPPDQPFEFVVHVFPQGEIEVTVGDEGPFPFHLPLTLPAIGFAGVYVKYGRALVEDAVVEILP